MVIIDIDKLSKIQDAYINQSDITLLGAMLDPELLPLLADIRLRQLLAATKIQIEHEIFNEIVIDAALRIVRKIEKNKRIKSFPVAMRWEVSNTLRDYLRYKRREIVFTDTGIDNDKI